MVAVSSICPIPAFSQEILESQGLRFRLIPGGSYLLGSPADEAARYADEAAPHVVELESFYLAVSETTNAQYHQFLKATGHKAPLYWQDKNLNGPTQPVVGVTWDDAAAFCRWLTQVTGVEQRLPTEAQWEAAARGGLPASPTPGARRPRTRAGSGGPISATPPPARMVIGSPRRWAPFRPMASACSTWPATSPNGARISMSPWPPPDPSGPVSSACSKGAPGSPRPGTLRAAARQAAPPRYADGYIGFRVVRLPNPSP